MFITHPDFVPFVIKRTSRDNFDMYSINANGLIDVSTQLSYAAAVMPFLNQNTTATKITNSAVSGSITLTSDADLFNEFMVGSFSRSTKLVPLVVLGLLRIQIQRSVTADVVTNFAGFGTGYATWWESAWSPYRGWPRSCAIYQQRLVMGGTRHQPDTLWFSQTGNFFQIQRSRRNSNFCRSRKHGGYCGWTHLFVDGGPKDYACR